MLQLNCKPCKADQSVWLSEKKDKYKYIAIYEADLLMAPE